MAIIDIFQWNGIRHRCSQCGANGIPRACACPGRRNGDGSHSGAHVEDWHEWLTVTDITVYGSWPTVRLERIDSAERSLT